MKLPSKEGVKAFLGSSVAVGIMMTAPYIEKALPSAEDRVRSWAVAQPTEVLRQKLADLEASKPNISGPRGSGRIPASIKIINTRVIESVLKERDDMSNLTPKTLPARNPQYTHKLNAEG